MFKLRKQRKIVSVTSTSSGDFLFIFGLGADGAMYVWDSMKCVWLLHRATNADAPTEAPAEAK